MRSADAIVRAAGLNPPVIPNKLSFLIKQGMNIETPLHLNPAKQKITAYFKEKTRIRKPGCQIAHVQSVSTCKTTRIPLKCD